MRYIKNFEDVRLTDVPLVGGKNASLGEMIGQLSTKIRVPAGFAITAQAYWYYLESNNFIERMKTIMATLHDPQDLVRLKQVGFEIRSLLESGTIPQDLIDEIQQSYTKLSKTYHQKNADVAVRSSATAEDLPEASFAGQQETFLNVRGIDQLITCIKKGIASLFTDRAIIYRIEKGFDHFKVALSIGVQKMVRSDKGASGVIFTLDTETGFKDIIMINASYGLGEAIVKGMVNPDEFWVFKTTLKHGFKPIIKKNLGDKSIKIVYAKNQNDMIVEVPVRTSDRNSFSLSDEEILELAQMASSIEDHYSALHKAWCPMDIEWAKDGIDNKLYIMQARPETVHVHDQNNANLIRYEINPDQQKKIIVDGQSIGQKIASGRARVAQTMRDVTSFEQGDILVTTMTDPDWVPIMKKAAAIVTAQGGRTSHAAIVSRELGIPAVVGCHDATQIIHDGQMITVDCSQGQKGFVYDGIVKTTKHVINIKDLPKIPAKLMVNVADPDQAIMISFLPQDGVGLARIEFIITNTIKIHPMAAIAPQKIINKKILKEIQYYARAYPDVKTFFIDSLAHGIGSIAAAFYPKPVVVRLSDFKSNEYRNLIGGTYYEPEEENPMLGLRGASRYYNPLYEPAFLLECAALKKVRNEMGLDNVKIMIPFVRTIAEAEKVISLMEHHGLKRAENNLEIYIMCEIPSNVILIDQFSQLIDGFSIGSNDLTQMTLAVDRDSAVLAPLFDERDEAVKMMMKLAVEGAQRNKIHSGICGQAPSDFPEIGRFLIDAGIDSLSLNPDSIISFLMSYQSK